jgi:hypothetical protein
LTIVRTFATRRSVRAKCIAPSMPRSSPSVSSSNTSLRGRQPPAASARSASTQLTTPAPSSPAPGERATVS